MKRYFPLLLLLLLLWLCNLSAANDQEAVRRAVAEGRLRPLAEIIALVQARHPGRIVDVDLEQQRGTYVYEIEILLPDRSKIEVRVDAASGDILDSERSARHSYSPLPVLLRQVQSRFGGYPIDVELEHGIYQIELVLEEGRRLRLAVDPETGQVIDDQQQEARWDRLQPMADVIETMLARYQGILLEAELERTADGRYYYELEIEDDSGYERSLHVDAISGEVLREGER